TTPLIALDDVVTATAGSTRTIAVLANDRVFQGTLATAQVQLPTEPITGTAVAEADGTITYSAPPTATGEDAFEYIVCSGEDLCESATVLVTLLSPANAATDLIPQSYLPFVQR
ncbi:MAG: hypothetical protein KDE58_39290, partial [Caldilineaceae bacterium]|nr:hypothetical protein [Caldilineaceae bacterium]